MEKKIDYFLYHLHSDLSNGTTNVDSVTKYTEYVEAAKNCGMKALAFSEHGNIFEWYFKKLSIEKAGMKYVHAVEAYITEDSEDSVTYFAKLKTGKKDIEISEYWQDDGECYGLTVPKKKGDEPEAVKIKPNTITEGQRKTRDNYHCILIAKNYNGFLELNQLMSEAYNREDNHFHYYPRIRFDDLIQTSDNIIITTACIAGILHKPSPLKNSTIRERFISFMRENKHRCYLEIQHHNVKEQIEYNQLLYKLSQNTGIPLIVGTDTHVLNDEQAKARHILQIAKGVYFDGEDDWDLIFKTPEELWNAYKEQASLPMDIVEQAMQNSLDLADQIEEFTIDTKAKYPKLYENSEEIFQEKIERGIEKLGYRDYPNWPEYEERIKSEYKVYKDNGAIDFMLLEEDVKGSLAKEGVIPGPSRGSVSGSIIANLLDITYVDSVKYHLNFERFMNSERVSLADVDSDWYSEDKDKVKDYLHHREGLYCCEIVTFNTIKQKSAIDNVVKGLYGDGESNKYLSIAESIKAACCKDDGDNDSNKNFDIEKISRKHPDIYKKYKKVFEYANVIIDCIVSVGNHPAGTVVAPFPITDQIGTFTTGKCKYPVSVLYMKEIDSLNYVKLDVLGLDNVGLIQKTCKLAGIDVITPRNLEFDDEKIWLDMRDDTTMIFQFESDMASQYLKELFSDETVKKIKKRDPNFSYLNLMSMGTAALRPAGASYREQLSHGIFKIHGNESLDEFMAPSLGYMIYQETIMNFLHEFCGYTMGGADIVRRGFAKKSGTEQFVPAIKSGFIEDMEKNHNTEREESEKLIGNFLKVIEDASDYAFSENHAVPYTMISYMCGWLRYYYKLEFVTTALNIFNDKPTKFLEITEYARRFGFNIKDCKFRYSRADYTCDRQESPTDIYKGIKSIKCLNSDAAESLYELRNNHYESFIDLLFDIKNLKSVKSNMLVALISINFFDEFGDRGYLIEQLKLFRHFYGKKSVKKNFSQFDAAGVNINKAKINQLLSIISTKESVSAWNVNMEKFLKECIKYLDWKPFSPTEIVKAEYEYLGYVDYQNPDMNYQGIVLDIVTKGNSNAKVYSIKNGTTLNCKIKKEKFAKSPLKKGDLLMISGTENKAKYTVNEEGKWVRSETDKDLYLTSYRLINELYEVQRGSI